MTTKEVHLIYRHLWKLAFPERHKVSRARYRDKNALKNKLTHSLYADLMYYGFNEEALEAAKIKKRKIKYGTHGKLAELTHELHREIICQEKLRK